MKNLKIFLALWLAIMTVLYISDKYFGVDILNVDGQISYIKKKLNHKDAVKKELVNDTQLNLYDDGSVSAKQENEIRQVLEIFKNKCQPLMGAYADDITFAELTVTHAKQGDYCMNYQCNKYGWEKQYRFVVKVKNRPTTIKKREDLYAMGHTITFTFGNAGKPGMTIDKFPNLCGKKGIDGHKTYVSIPEFSIIDDTL